MAKTSEPKKPGRPRGRSKGRPNLDGGVGSETILNVACDMVKTMTPEKITRAEIARRAGVDPGLIRYYFSDRSSLLRATAAKISAEFQKAAEEMIVEDASPEDNLRTRIRAFLKLHLEYPYFHRLVVEELVDLGADEEGAEVINTISQRGHSAYLEILGSGANSEEFREVDTKMFYVLVISVLSFSSSAKRILNHLDHPVVEGDRYLEEMSEFLADMLLKGLMTRETPE